MGGGVFQAVTSHVFGLAVEDLGLDAVSRLDRGCLSGSFRDFEWIEWILAASSAFWGTGLAFSTARLPFRAESSFSRCACRRVGTAQTSETLRWGVIQRDAPAICCGSRRGK